MLTEGVKVIGLSQDYCFDILNWNCPGLPGTSQGKDNSNRRGVHLLNNKIGLVFDHALLVPIVFEGVKVIGLGLLL